MFPLNLFFVHPLARPIIRGRGQKSEDQLQIPPGQHYITKPKGKQYDQFLHRGHWLIRVPDELSIDTDENDNHLGILQARIIANLTRYQINMLADQQEIQKQLEEAQQVAQST